MLYRHVWTLCTATVNWIANILIASTVEGALPTDTYGRLSVTVIRKESPAQSTSTF